jgi:FkbM family methyltransferase
VRVRQRLQLALLRRLARGLGEKRALYLFRQLALRFHVDEVVSAGIQGKLDDEVVFARYLRSGSWAPQITEFLVRCFAGESAGTFVDIGANLGLVTLAVARLGYVDCKCFEPEPDNLALLRENVARSDAGERVEIFPFALWREETRLEFELSARNRGDHRVRIGAAGADDEAELRVISVPARPLDAVLDATTLRRPLVVKCDAQGSEAHIWAGGANTLARADALVLEFWPYGLARVGSRPDELIERLIADYDRGWLVLGNDAIRPGAAVPIESVADALRGFNRDAHPHQHADVIAVREAMFARFASPRTSPR